MKIMNLFLDIIMYLKNLIMEVVNNFFFVKDIICYNFLLFFFDF